ncbi:MAG TPA: hypothetical protein VEG34_10615 [Thermoanaerobaculia bacterium]|nr:hypothetical protein [Thermoanaerobaculia bacterium]
MMRATQNIPRWTAWARALAGRHGRRHERVDRLALELARPRTLARSVQQRWIVSSRMVQPRISLAIQPVLHGTFWRGGTVAERTLRTVRDERFRETERVREMERLREVEPGRTLGNRHDRAERASKAPALARSLAARVRREETLLHGGTATRVLRESAASAKREERTTEPAATPRGADPRRPEIPGWGSPAAAPGRFAAPAAPPINVEALTDQVMRQIDRRVGAWRERTGGF